jgi:hypothetical protein
MMAYSHFQPELKRFAEKAIDYDEISSYVIKLSFKTMIVMQIIRLFMKRRENTAVAWLRNAFLRDSQHYARGGALVARVTGDKNRKKKQIEVSIVDDRHYWLTGIPPALVVQFILNGAMKETGCNYLCDAIDPSMFMKALNKAGLNIEIKV